MLFKEIRVGQKFKSCKTGLEYIKLDYGIMSCDIEVNACCLSLGKYQGQCMVFSLNEEVEINDYDSSILIPRNQVIKTIIDSPNWKRNLVIEAIAKIETETDIIKLKYSDFLILMNSLKENEKNYKSKYDELFAYLKPIDRNFKEE